MAFNIEGLNPDFFTPYVGLSEAALAALGAQRMIVTEKPGSPCRITLADAEIGESVLLLRYEHQPADTPYRQTGPIFIREAARAAFAGSDMVPLALAIRTLSLRAYDAGGAMIDAEVVEGAAMAAAAERIFANLAVQDIHAHYAKRGCFAARLTRR